MEDSKFVESIVKVAAKLKGCAITDVERQQIINTFNSIEGDPAERAKIAVKKVTGKAVPRQFLLLESEGSINELANLVAELEEAAKEWIKN